LTEKYKHIFVQITMRFSPVVNSVYVVIAWRSRLSL